MSEKSVYSIPDDISSEHARKQVKFGGIATPVEILNLSEETIAPVQERIRNNYYKYFNILKKTQQVPYQEYSDTLFLNFTCDIGTFNSM